MADSIVGGKYQGNQPVQGSFDLSRAVIYKDTTLTTSTDPFAGKTNKFAESPLVEVQAVLQAIHVRMGASGITAAVTTDYYIPAGEKKVFKVNPDRPYMRIIENMAGANSYVTEIY